MVPVAVSGVAVHLWSRLDEPAAVTEARAWVAEARPTEPVKADTPPGPAWERTGPHAADPADVDRALAHLAAAIEGQAELAELEDSRGQEPQIIYLGFPGTLAEKDASRLAGLRAVAELYGGRPVDLSPDGARVTVQVRVEVDGVELAPWTSVVDPQVVAEARAWVAEAAR